MVKRPSWRSRSDRESLPEVRECQKAILKAWEWTGGPPRGPGVVERSSRRFGSGWEALSEVRERSGGPPKGPGVVGRPSRRS